jgi:hypothetical protein
MKNFIFILFIFVSLFIFNITNAWWPNQREWYLDYWNCSELANKYLDKKITLSNEKFNCYLLSPNYNSFSKSTLFLLDHNSSKNYGIWPLGTPYTDLDILEKLKEFKHKNIELNWSGSNWYIMIWTWDVYISWLTFFEDIKEITVNKEDIAKSILTQLYITIEKNTPSYKDRINKIQHLKDKFLKLNNQNLSEDNLLLLSSIITSLDWKITGYEKILKLRPEKEKYDIWIFFDSETFIVWTDYNLWYSLYREWNTIEDESFNWEIEINIDWKKDNTYMFLGTMIRLNAFNFDTPWYKTITIKWLNLIDWSIEKVIYVKK